MCTSKKWSGLASVLLMVVIVATGCEKATPEPVLPGTPVPIPAAAISPDNADQVIEIARYDKERVKEVAWSPDGQLLAVASVTGISLYDVETMTEVHFIETEAQVESVAFSPDGGTLASAGRDNLVKLWDVASGQEMLALSGHEDYVMSVAFSPNGKQLVSGSWDKTVRLWDIAGEQELYTLSGHTKEVENVAFSPDGKSVASASDDWTAKLWDVASGQELYTLQGPAKYMLSVAFSPDGELLASGSDDIIVQLWDVANGQEIRQVGRLRGLGQNHRPVGRCRRGGGVQIAGAAHGCRGERGLLARWQAAGLMQQGWHHPPVGGGTTAVSLCVRRGRCPLLGAVVMA